jgi:hypothetical protein
MNEAIGAAVYLVLALAVVAGIRAAFWNAEPEKKLKKVTAPVRLPRAAPAGNARKVQRPSPHVQQGHALPWVIPTALAPAESHFNNKKPATVKTISERLEIVELRLDRIAGRVAQ